MKRSTIDVIFVGVAIWVVFCLIVDIHPIKDFFRMISEVSTKTLSIPFIVLAAVMTWLVRNEKEENSEV